VIPEGSRIPGFKGSSANAKELQRFESLAKVIRFCLQIGHADIISRRFRFN